jgi:molybdopterin molybdotransferase
MLFFAEDGVPLIYLTHQRVEPFLFPIHPQLVSHAQAFFGIAVLITVGSCLKAKPSRLNPPTFVKDGRFVRVHRVRVDFNYSEQDSNREHFSDSYTSGGKGRPSGCDASRNRGIRAGRCYHINIGQSQRRVGRGLMSGAAFDVRMRGFRDRSDVADVVAAIDARVAALETEWAPLAEACGRRLAEPIVAAFPVPGFPRSAMDGYALRAEETFGASAYEERLFRVIGVSMPGVDCTLTVRPGEAVRIMTGAPMPAAADAVLMAEYADATGESVIARDSVPPGRHVSQVGEDVRAGAVVLAPPRTLRPQDVAVAAALGFDALPVVRKPRVAILVTGNELLPPGSKPVGARIVDVNSVLLRTLLERDGAIVETGADGSIPILPDDRSTIRGALANSRADCILITGGTSVGQEDHAPMLLAELGELAFHGLALRPAAPAGLGFLNGKPVFLMPGNPVSCLCAYDLLAGRAIRRLQGRSSESPYPTRRLMLAQKLVSAIGRVDYARVRLTAEGKVEPLSISGASILSSAVRADGFVVVPKDLEGYAEGSEVVVHLYDID